MGGLAKASGWTFTEEKIEKADGENKCVLNHRLNCDLI